MNTELLEMQLSRLGEAVYELDSRPVITDVCERSENKISELFPEMGDEQEIVNVLSILTLHPHQVEAALEAGLSGSMLIMKAFADIRTR